MLCYVILGLQLGTYNNSKNVTPETIKRFFKIAIYLKYSFDNLPGFLWQYVIFVSNNQG